MCGFRAYPTLQQIRSCNIRLDESTGLLKLPKHKDPVRLKLHRKIKPGGKLKSVTVTQEPDEKRYYSILMEYPKTHVSQGHQIRITDPVWIIPCRNCMWTATGNPREYPNPYRNMEPKLAKEQKKLSRKKPGSRRYEEQRRKVAKLHAKSKHQRSDFLHKLSCFLTDTYDLIAIEDLDMSAMKRGAPLW